MVIEFFNEMCLACLDQIGIYNKLYNLIEHDGKLKNNVKIIGVGVGGSNRSVAKYRRKEKVLFPLFADRNNEIFKALGKPTLPSIYLIKKTVNDQGGKIIMSYSGHIDEAGQIFDWLKRSVAATHE